MNQQSFWFRRSSSSFSMISVSLFLGIIITTTFAPGVQSGCYQRQLCCPGRDLACKALKGNAVPINVSPPPPRPPPRPPQPNEQQPRRTTRSVISPSSTATPTPSSSTSTSTPTSSTHQIYRTSTRRPRHSKKEHISPDVEDNYISEWHVHIDPNRKFEHDKFKDLTIKHFFDSLHYDSRRLADLTIPDDDNEIGSGFGLVEKMLNKAMMNGSASEEEADGGKDTDSFAVDGAPTAKNDVLFTDDFKDHYKVYFGKKQLRTSAEVQEKLGDDTIIKYVIIKEEIPIAYEKLGLLQLSDSDFCYCDEACTHLGDCCPDYYQTCPARDCSVSAWAAWSPCTLMTNGSAETGECQGMSVRERQVTVPAEHGGEPCPHLHENRLCHPLRCPEEILSETALIIPHKFAVARNPGHNPKIYYDFPKETLRLKHMKSYCADFRVTWLDSGCIHRDTIVDLREGMHVCVECQPAAQNKPGKRCKGEGLDGRESFWRTLGKHDCLGAWKRARKTEECSCASQSSSPSFIFV